jgi:hypothetical protein
MVTYATAALNGTLNPGGSPTTYFFQYGPSAKYGSQSLPVSLAAGTRTLNVRSPIAGLVPQTKYHFRLVAVNAVGTAVGTDATFTSAVVPLSLAIGATPDPVVFGAPVSVIGAVTGTGAGGRPVVLQQRPFPYTAPFQNVGNPGLTLASGVFTFTLVSLPVTTQFQVVSVAAGKAVISPVLTENVGLAVSMRASSRRTRTGSYSVRFSGTVSPAEDGARVSVQRLVGSQWKLVAATNARHSSAGSSSYVKTVHRHHGGFFRVFVSPVEGGHVANFSQPQLIHLGRSF